MSFKPNTDLFDEFKKVMESMQKPEKVKRINKFKYNEPDKWEPDGEDSDPYLDEAEKEITGLDESFSEMNQIAERLAEALDAGESIDWMLLKGDRMSKKAAKWWLAKKAEQKAKEEAKRKRAEKKAKETQMMRDILSKLSDEEKALLKLDKKVV